MADPTKEAGTFLHTFTNLVTLRFLMLQTLVPCM